jgi:hypothetical protein
MERFGNETTTGKMEMKTDIVYEIEQQQLRW